MGWEELRSGQERDSARLEGMRRRELGEVLKGEWEGDTGSDEKGARGGEEG